VAFPKCTGCSFRAGVKKPKRPVGGSLSMNSGVLLATEPRFGSFWGYSPGLGKGCRLAYLGSLGSQTGSGAFRVISAARAWRSRVCRRQSLGASPPELSGRFNSGHHQPLKPSAQSRFRVFPAPRCNRSQIRSQMSGTHHWPAPERSQAETPSR
jgi:hypothetical protein